MFLQDLKDKFEKNKNHIDFLKNKELKEFLNEICPHLKETFLKDNPEKNLIFEIELDFSDEGESYLTSNMYIELPKHKPRYEYAEEELDSLNEYSEMMFRILKYYLDLDIKDKPRYNLKINNSDCTLTKRLLKSYKVILEMRF